MSRIPFSKSLFSYDSVDALSNTPLLYSVSPHGVFDQSVLDNQLKEDNILVEKTKRVYLNVYGGNSYTDFGITGNSIPALHYVFSETAFVPSMLEGSILKKTLLQHREEDMYISMSLREMYAALCTSKRFAILCFEGSYTNDYELTKYIRKELGFSVINLECYGKKDGRQYGRVEVMVSLFKVSARASQMLYALGFNVPLCLSVFPFRNLDVFAGLNSIAAQAKNAEGITKHMRKAFFRTPKGARYLCGVLTAGSWSYLTTMYHMNDDKSMDTHVFGTDLHLGLTAPSKSQTTLVKFGKGSAVRKVFYLYDWRVVAYRIENSAMLSSWMKDASHMLLHPKFNSVLEQRWNRHALETLKDSSIEAMYRTLLCEETDSPIEAARLALKHNAA